MNPVGTESATPETARFERLEPARVEVLNRLHDLIETMHQDDREKRRYGAAAETSEPCLCTPVDYSEHDLSHIPERILSVDYGCGDPTRYAEEGDTVLDLGSGSGKHCFMMARKVGPNGHVIGIDKTPQMLELSRGAVDEVTTALDYPKPMVEFRRGHIENLCWGLDRLEELSTEHPPTTYENLDAIATSLESEPLVASESVDLVVSNCVLNLVEDHRKPQLFRELHRVLRRGGRAIISDIVAARDVPAEMKEDERLWTGCISGAMRRDRFLQAFLDAGFYGVEELSSFFWQKEGGIHFYSVTIAAYKGKEGPCWETYRNAFYRGPFSAVEDDDGHRYERGVPAAVCEKTANILSRPPYAGHFLVSKALADESEHIPFDCSGTTRGTVPDDIREKMDHDTGPMTDGESCSGPGCC